MEIKYQEADIDAVLLHWVKDYEVNDGQSIVKHEWSINPVTGKVVFKLFIKDATQ
jgi:hypothetical protein